MVDREVSLYHSFEVEKKERCGDTPGKGGHYRATSSPARPPRVCGECMAFLFSSFPVVSSPRTLHTLHKSLWMKPSWSLPFPAPAETDLVIKPGGCWPMRSPEFVIAVSVRTIAYSGSTWEDTGPEGRTRPQLPLFCYMLILQATTLHLVVTGLVPGERCAFSGIREIAEGEACSPTVNNCWSQGSTQVVYLTLM